MKKALLCAACLLALSFGPSVHATTISLYLQETGKAALTASSNTGFVTINSTTYGNFLLNEVLGLGTPLRQTPELNLQTLDVSSFGLNKQVTLTIKLTETGLNALKNPQPVVSVLAGILSGISSETISTYYDSSDTAYGTGTLLSTKTFTSTGVKSFTQDGSISAFGPYSETEIISATFGVTPGTDSLSSSALISPVPEPSALLLLGSGLLALACVIKMKSLA